ncbi:segment polarity protein dishevelled homolog DVL-3-like isoform X5 [Tachypleus tridentatus]|uniref:segment polarity protein dishevelled homolog DVL-3-like isoform X5 n=1 Tax=Tachypleus tridentatus TaxID=6853 RepID=UPI003FD4FB6B
MEETKVIYHVDDEETPYLVKLPINSDRVTLADFKSVLNKPSFKYFFKSMDDDFGMVKEEIVEDDAKLPCFNGRVVSWLVTAEGSNASDGTSQCTDRSDIRSSKDKTGRPHDLRPPSYHSHLVDSLCDSTCTETESVISSRRGRINGHNKHGLGQKHQGGHAYENSSMVISDTDTTSFVDSEDETTSRISTTTGESSVSKIHARHRRRRRRHRMPPMSRVRGDNCGIPNFQDGVSHCIERTSSISSITESTMSLNIITVTLNIDTVNFLGISIVGQSNKGGDGGIYVGSIMKGGAVALDGRIEPGDMILQVNDINFENMSNDDAVRVLREAVQKSGPIKLVVAKCWNPKSKGYFTVPRLEPVRPIDPGAWIAHTEAVQGADYLLRPSSVNTLTSTSSSITSSIPEAECHFQETPLTIETDMSTVVKAMAAPDSGLDIQDRMWLKITIPKAFIGADVVHWLLNHVQGFQDRREARKYAIQMLKAGFIRHTVNKITFSEQCYYVFGDLCNNMTALKVTDEEVGSETSQDTLGPLLPPTTQSPWGVKMPYSGNYSPQIMGFVPMSLHYTNEASFLPEGSVHSGSGGSSNSGETKKENEIKSSSPMGSEMEVPSVQSDGYHGDLGVERGAGSSGSEHSFNTQSSQDIAHFEAVLPELRGIRPLVNRYECFVQRTVSFTSLLPKLKMTSWTTTSLTKELYNWYLIFIGMVTMACIENKITMELLLLDAQLFWITTDKEVVKLASFSFDKVTVDLLQGTVLLYQPNVKFLMKVHKCS